MAGIIPFAIIIIGYRMHLVTCFATNYKGFSVLGKGIFSNSVYNEMTENLCQPTAIPLEQLLNYGSPLVLSFTCPNKNVISSIEYMTDSLKYYITGLRFGCSDGLSNIYVGSQEYNSADVKDRYEGDGINEVAFGYDAVEPIIRLIKIVKEEKFPIPSKILLSYMSKSESLYRSYTLLGDKPTGLCAVIILNSRFKNPIISNLRIKFASERPLSNIPYNGFVYTGIPKISLSKVLDKNCPTISGVAPGTAEDIYPFISCPEGYHIIGINTILGDDISAVSLRSISQGFEKEIRLKVGSKGNLDSEIKDLEEKNRKKDTLIDSIDFDSQDISKSNLDMTEENEHRTVSNGEILMLKFLCSDYITSVSLGQPLSNMTSWNILDSIPKVDSWVNSQTLQDKNLKALIQSESEKSIVRGTSDVKLGNINTLLIGYTTGKLQIEAFIDAQSTSGLGRLSEIVDRYTFGPIFIHANEFIDFQLNTRNIIRSVPQVYISNPINRINSYSGEFFTGVCSRIIQGTFLIGNIGFSTAKPIKPFFPQVYLSRDIIFESANTEFPSKCEMIKKNINEHDENTDTVRSSLRSIQGIFKCPPGFSIESIQILVNLNEDLIESMRFNCGNSFESFIVLGSPNYMTEFSNNSKPNINVNGLKLISTAFNTKDPSFDNIKSILAAFSKPIFSSALFIPDSLLPIGYFKVLQAAEDPKIVENTLIFNSKLYPAKEDLQKIWKGGVLTQVCADISPGGVIRNLGFYFEYPFKPTVQKAINDYYGYVSQGSGTLEVDSKNFICPEMLHSPRAQFLFSKHIEEIIVQGHLQPLSKKTALRAINYICPANSVIDRVEVTWQFERNLKTMDMLNPLLKSRNTGGSIAAMRFFCSDGESVLKIGADANPTHTQKVVEIHEVFLGYDALPRSQFEALKKTLVVNQSTQITEDLLLTIPGDPVSFKLIHESFPVSTIVMNVERAQYYTSATEALSTDKSVQKREYLKSLIWRGGKWKGVCIGLLNISGGILISNEFSIVSFGSYFEEPSPIAKRPYEGFLYTGVPQINLDKIVSTCNMSQSPSLKNKYSGFSASFLCPDGTYIERIGYGTEDKSSDKSYEALKNGTAVLPSPYKESRHLGPLKQITALHIVCSDGISTITIGQPSKAVAYSKPGKIGAIRVGYIQSNSSLIDKSINPLDLLTPSSIDLYSSDLKYKLLKYSNPQYPSYLQRRNLWKGQNLLAVCVDYAVVPDERVARNKMNKDRLTWTGTETKIQETYAIMAIGFAFQKRSTEAGGKAKIVKVTQKLPKVNISRSRRSSKKDHSTITSQKKKFKLPWVFRSKL
ncbi:hypothetical protein ACR3K2_32850 [Cryptosporidium serpentis]